MHVVRRSARLPRRSRRCTHTAWPEGSGFQPTGLLGCAAFPLQECCLSGSHRALEGGAVRC